MRVEVDSRLQVHWVLPLYAFESLEAGHTNA